MKLTILGLTVLLSVSTLASSVRPYVFMPPIMPHDQSKPWNASSKKCDKKCPYGFESDVEGMPMCKCHDPCASVMCLGGYQCVVEKPRQCTKEPCKYFAACKDVNVCELPHEENIDTCDIGMTRWYYDYDIGKCRKFYGCHSNTGNNFRRKRECKKKCYPKYRRIQKKVQKRKEKLLKNKMRKDKKTTLPVKEYKNPRTLEWHFPMCRPEQPFQKCTPHPCDSCKNTHILCVPNFCGQCTAMYIDLRTFKRIDNCKDQQKLNTSKEKED